MRQKVIVVGGTGMAGQAFLAELKRQGYEAIGLSRNGPDLFFDALTEMKNIENEIIKIEPALIINCAAIVSLEICNDYPCKAEMINAILPKVLANCASQNNARLIQVSTDHFYSGDRDKLHVEEDEIQLVNKYAETKYLGELNCLEYVKSLIIRTNITGYRGEAERPTFIEWLHKSITNQLPLKLFNDFYTSTIDTETFCKLCLNPALATESGIFNIASRKALSKKAFAELIARKLKINLDWAEEASVLTLGLRRAESLGLNCNKAEKVIGQKMPEPNIVAHRLVNASTSI